MHPRWSYVRLHDGQVVEAAEKKPLSRHAIAGFYYLAQGSRFVRAATRSLLAQASVDGRFYVAPVFNQLILAGDNVRALPLPAGAYQSSYTPQRIEEYERAQGRRSAPCIDDAAMQGLHAAVVWRMAQRMRPAEIGL